MSTNKKPGRKPGVSSFVEMTLAELTEVYGPKDKIRVSLVQLNKVRDGIHNSAVAAKPDPEDEPEVPAPVPEVASPVETEVPVTEDPEAF